MVDEAHITTIAIRHAWRGRGLGELLLVSLIDLAVGRDIERVTLEVRVSNETAQNLYQKYGFRHEGVRHRYYSDNNEDAYIMTTGVIQEEAYQRELDARLAALIRRLQSDSEYEIHAPAFIRLAGAQSAHGAD
jgi:ribosomal-protein-alanine N-acetyltransferase